MKRLFLLFSVIAALALTAGCNREEAGEPMNADMVTATFNVTMPGDIATKAISDGTQATELLFRVFDANDRLLESLNQTVTVTGKKATVTAKLVRGVTYKFVFWAQKPGKYTLANDSNGHLALTLSNSTLASMMNDDSFDAFYAMKAMAPQSADFAENITLYRPFAQINVGTGAADIISAQINKVDVTGSLKTAFTIKGVKNSLDLLTGKTSGSVDVTYTPTTAPSDNIVTRDGTSYRRVAMVYVLAPAEQSATVQTTLRVQTKQNNSIDVNFSREVPNVPVLRNHRTNIVGDVFCLQGLFNVLVDADFDQPDKEVEMGGTSTIPDTYTVSIQENIADGNVSLVAGNNQFEEGVTVALNVVPNNNYELAYLAYIPENGGNAVEINLKTLSFQMPAFNVVVTARFSEMETPPTPPSGEGSGTADDPYTVAGVRAYIDGLGQAGTVSENEVYVKGVVSRIASAPSERYSNASFYMTDPNGTDEFEAFRINYFDNAPWTVNDPMVAVGNEVVVFGKVTLYATNNTYETYQKANEYNGYLISINGSGTTPTVADTPVITSADATGATTTVIPAEAGAALTVTITGTNVRYTTNGSDPTANSTAYTAPFTVTQACTIKAIAIGEGDTQNSAIASLSITKAATPGDNDGSGTADDPYTVAGVRAYIDGLGTAIPSENEVYVKGVIKSIPNNGQFSTQFGNATFFMTDPNGTDEFEAYRVLYFGNRAWVAGDALVEVGQEAVVCGRVTLYTNTNTGAKTYETYQVNKDGTVYNGHLVSLDGKSAAAAAPTITAAGADGGSSTVIPAADGSYLTVTITGSNVRYTTDGSDPTASSATYSAPFRVTSACTVKAIAIGNANTLNSSAVSLKITKASAGVSSWVETPLANITSGAQVVIVSEKEGNYYALSNDKGTSASPAPISVTPSNGTLSNVADEIIWIMTIDGSNYKFGLDGTNYLYCQNANTGVRVGDNENNTFTFDSEKKYFKHTATNRYIGVYFDTNGAKDWRCYTSDPTTNNLKGQTFHIFVKQ